MSMRLAAIVCLGVMLSAQTTAPTVRVFYNARIFTADPGHPAADAIAIRDDRIVAVGSRAAVFKAAGPAAEKHDLRGKTLLPGIIDSHVHPVLGGFILTSPDADGWGREVSMPDLVTIATEAVRSGRGLRGDILMISRVPVTMWSKTDDLNARFSAGEFEQRPVFLWGVDGHTGWANRALRLRAGLTKDFLSSLSEDERAKFGMTRDFEPNGFGVDDGLAKIVTALPPQNRDERLAWTRSAVRYLNSFGITAWLDAQADVPTLNNYKDLFERGELTAHVAAFPVVIAAPLSAADPLARVVALQKQFADVKNVTIPGIKIYTDGVVEYPSQTAAMSVPYKNSRRLEDLLFDPARFAQVVSAADRQGLIVHIHAVGDRAVTASLDAIEAARRANGNSGLPHTIAHLQFVAPSDVPRFKQLGVVADVQLLWASANQESIELVKPYVDPAIYNRQYPARSLLDAGATIAGGSDWYVSSPNPFLAIYQAETRKGPEGVLGPHERMPRLPMLYAYTRNAALAMHALNEIGSLAPGKQADFVIVDRDVLHVPIEQLRDTRVLWTVLGGKTVFGADPSIVGGRGGFHD
jgi:predicted amidohydrolase YtcJ